MYQIRWCASRNPSRLQTMFWKLQFVNAGEDGHQLPGIKWVSPILLALRFQNFQHYQGAQPGAQPRAPLRASSCAKCANRKLKGTQGINCIRNRTIALNAYQVRAAIRITVRTTVLLCITESVTNSIGCLAIGNGQCPLDIRFEWSIRIEIQRAPKLWESAE